MADNCRHGLWLQHLERGDYEEIEERLGVRGGHAEARLGGGGGAGLLDGLLESLT